MVQVVLVEPEIPQNTGNIARTCAATGTTLHLVHPLGFSTDDRWVRRAGLDYWHLVEVIHHDSVDGFLSKHGEEPLFLFSTRGTTPYTSIDYPTDGFILFGKETAGLPDRLIHSKKYPTVRIPVRTDARSLNLSNAVAIVLYESMRQRGFPGLDPSPRNQNRDTVV